MSNQNNIEAIIDHFVRQRKEEFCGCDCPPCIYECQGVCGRPQVYIGDVLSYIENKCGIIDRMGTMTLLLKRWPLNRFHYSLQQTSENDTAESRKLFELLKTLT